MYKNKSRNIDPLVTVTSEECNGNAEKMIRKFSKKVKKLGLMDLLREKRYFISKSEKKRIKKRKKRRLSREDTAKRNKY